MRKLITIIGISLASFVLSCKTPFAYEPDPANSKPIELIVAKSDSIYADSLTQYKVIVHSPGLQAQSASQVTLTTNWGYWPNKTQTIVAASSFDSKNGYFVSETYLTSARTVQPFAVTVSVNGKQAEFALKSIARYPDIVQIVPDSFSLKRKQGNSTLVKVYFTSFIGYPSYGIRLSFTGSQPVTFLPVQSDFNLNRPVRTRVLLSSTAFTQDTLTVGGILLNTANQPKIRVAKIFLKR